MANIDLTVLNVNTEGVSLSDTTANQLTTVFKWTLPRGRAAVIPGTFLPIWEFKQSSGAEIDPLSEIYFGIMIPSDPRRVYHLGSKIIYRAWYDLTVAQMQNELYQDALKVDLGLPYLALSPQDSFVIMLYSPSVCDAGSNSSHITISIPYFERKPGTISTELDVRHAHIGV